MKYLLLVAILFGGYKYYNHDFIESTGTPILDKIRNEPVSRQELIDFVVPSLFDSCSKIPNKNHVRECTDLLNSKKKFCVKIFNLRTPEFVTSEDLLMERMATLTNCLVDQKVF